VRSDRPPGTLCYPCDPVLACSPSGVQAGERVIPSDCSTSTTHDQVSEVVSSSDPLVPVGPAPTVTTPEQDPTSFTDQVPSSSDPIIVETVEKERVDSDASTSSSGDHELDPILPNDCELDEPCLVSQINMDSLPFCSAFDKFVEESGYVDAEARALESARLAEEEPLRECDTYDLSDLLKDPALDRPKAVSFAPNRWHISKKASKKKKPPKQVKKKRFKRAPIFAAPSSPSVGTSTTASLSDPESLTASEVLLEDGSTVQICQVDDDECYVQELTTACAVAPDLSVDPLEEYLRVHKMQTPIAIQALFQFRELVQQSGLDVCAYYQKVKDENPDLFEQVCAHLDAGSQGSTTDRKDILFWYRDCITNKTFNPADKKEAHKPQGYGYCKLKCRDGRVLVHKVWYTPSLPATIFSPMAMANEHDCQGYASIGIFGNAHSSILQLLHCKKSSMNIKLEGQLRGGLLFSSPLILPSCDEDRQPRNSRFRVPLEQPTDPTPEVPTPKQAHSVAGSSPCQDSTGTLCCPCNPHPAEVAQVGDTSGSSALPACGHATCSGSCPSITAPADLSMCPSCGGDTSTPSFTINPSVEPGAVPKCEFCCPSCRAPLEVPSAFEELLFIQRLGFQDTLDLAATCKAVDGLPHFTSAGVHYTVLDGDPALVPLTDAAAPCSSLAEVGESSEVEESHPVGESSRAGESSLPADGTIFPVGGGVSSAAAKEELEAALFKDGLLAMFDLCDAPFTTMNDVCSCQSHTHSIEALSVDQKRVLWHQRLGHLNSRAVHDLYKAVDGVPAVPLATELEKCPVCLAAKLKKAARGDLDSRKATVPYQGLSIDFGFVVQASADTARYKRLVGLNGETCYCLITDHCTGTLHGQSFCSKAPPVDFIKYFLADHADPTVRGKYVRMDRGELTSSQILELFQHYGYEVQITGADASTMNGAGERPHRTIATAMRTMLSGAGLPPKFWPYCFAYILRLYNLTVHEGQTKTPYELKTGKRPNLSYLRTFGCRVYARASGPKTHPDKAVPNARTGIFLGFHKTFRNVLYYDVDSGEVKWTPHATFDEAMNDVPIVDRPPNVKLLLNAAGKRPFTDDDVPDENIPELDVTTNPFSEVFEYTPSKGNWKDPLLGLEFKDCAYRYRAYISGLLPQRRRGLSKRMASRLIGSYVVAVNSIPVRTSADVRAAMLLADTNDEPVTLVLAPELQSENKARPTHLSLRLNELRHICALQYGSGERSDSIQADIDALHEACDDAMLSEMIRTVQENRQENDYPPATPEEIALPSLTRHRLKRLTTWPLWRKAFHKQLDDHAKEGVLGEPMKRPPGAIVLRGQWSQAIKMDNRRKARLCADGSKRAQPMLHRLLQTYSSCIETPCMRLFFALAAAEGMYITGADCTNAFQQCPPPKIQLYLQIDEAYIEWWNDRHPDPKDKLDYARDKHLVLPILKNLQGLPSAGAAWEEHFSKILNEMGFKSTTHEKNIYQGVYQGQRVLIAAQVDDLVIGTHDPKLANSIIEYIASRGVTIRNDGLCLRFNGLDIEQTRSYVKISCHKYIDKVLKLHGWDKPGANESDHCKLIPMSDQKVQELQLIDEGPKVGTPEHAALEKEAGFDYRQVLGETIYAYVVCRQDISFAVTFLARYATCPSLKHYAALKHIWRYLRSTPDWGIVYWRDKDKMRSDLPNKEWQGPSMPANEEDPNLTDFPAPSSLLELVGFVDASHATCLKTRRSITGMVFMLAGGTVYYKSKLQATVSTSSTECELIAAVQAAKIAKYLRSVLAELGYPQSGPTILYEDNEAAIHVANNVRPTQRTRHVDIGWFAIQEWVQNGDIQMKFLKTNLMVADASTKAVPWVLHRRHCRRAMGHFGHPLESPPNG